MISGEYLVLDGAKALAVPTKLGQKMLVKDIEEHKLKWKSFDEKGNIWLERDFHFPIKIRKSDPKAIQTLKKLFLSIQLQNPDFLKYNRGFSVETHLEFPRNWGLGSSSTLIYNLANWAKVNPYLILKETFGGSGYDIACAGNISPLTYQLTEKEPIIELVDFNPVFNEQLYFIYLNQKQKSNVEVKKYQNQSIMEKKIIVNLVSEITEIMLKVTDIKDFELLMKEHELLLSRILNRKPIQSHFKNYFGQLKSLGAWGGDFMLATGNENTPNYFKERGFETVIRYKDLII